MPEIRRIILSSQPRTDVSIHHATPSNPWSAGGPEPGIVLPEAASHAPSFSPHASSQPKLVMIIDDSPTVRKIIEVSLQREGLEVVSYPDGIEALQAVTNHHLNRLPDLVILDLDLPKMNGFEIARYLRSKPQWSQTVIVILSRHGSMVDRLKARLTGTQAYVTKPFAIQLIVDVVQTALRLSQPSPVSPVASTKKTY